MIVIDLPTDLHQEDDDGLNIAFLDEAPNQDRVTPGAVLVAGKPSGWSWVSVESVDAAGVAHFRQISMQEARAQTQLAVLATSR